jgi:hypothetical protein
MPADQSSAGRFELALRRLGTFTGVLALVTLPVLAALFTEGRGTPAQLTTWRIGLLAMWTIAFLAMVRCLSSVLHLVLGRASTTRRSPGPRRSAGSA